MSAVTLILNARSGGGRHQPAIRAAAARRGIDVREVGSAGGPAELAAAADADVLVVAGGDGTVSDVAGVAVARGVPLVVLPCGTRNHFALDVGLDPGDPAAGLHALDDGVERRIDVGTVNGRVFLNNVFYATMVRDPQYRSRRVAVSWRYAHRALLGGGEPMVVTTEVAPRTVLPDQVLTVLISNNAYSPGVAPGASLRPRMDEGMLWTHVLGVDRKQGPLVLRVVRTVTSLLVGRSQVAAWPAAVLTLAVDRPSVTVGLDGEAVDLATPLTLRARPGALRLLGPRRPDPGPVRMELFT